MRPLAAIIAFTLLFFSNAQMSAQQFLARRTSEKLAEWSFYKGDIFGAESGSPIDETGWTKVNVPHTWNAKDVLTGGPRYYQGSGWYRTSFSVAPALADKRAFIRFEGASSVAEVWLNGTYLGRHEGGYSAFAFEITKHLRHDSPNILAVKVNNEASRNVAPSSTALYPLFGGIYRPVTLFFAPEVCVSPLDRASSGVYVSPSNVSATGADVNVRVLVSREIAISPKYNPREITTANGDNGWDAKYYANPDFTGIPVHARLDRSPNFDFRTGAPFPDMKNDDFSIVWESVIVPEKSGVYRFYLNSDDGARLTIGDKVVIDNFGTHSAEKTATGEIELAAGKSIIDGYPIKLEYYEKGGEASVDLKWTALPDPNDAPVSIVKAEVIDADGNTVASSSCTAATANGTTTPALVDMHIDNPKLWDGRRGAYLYKMRVTVTDDASKPGDVVEQSFGLRDFRVDKDEGLILNGKYYDLHGVARHQEIEGKGTALSPEDERGDFNDMLDLGCTGLRLAHYQQSDAMYSMADSAGMVIWAEIPNTPFYRADNPAYLSNCESQLEELVKQNYNHPSIFFWGMYNEIDMPVEHLRQLNDLAHALDRTRPTTAADLAEPSPRHAVTDLVAYNKYFGWYYGDFGEYDAWFENVRNTLPNVCAGLSEYGAGGCVDQHDNQPKKPDAWNGKFYPEEYQTLAHEQIWSRIKDRHDIWCKFVWNYADFSWTNVDRGDRPYINHKGLVTHDRKIHKDAYYFYKANWSDKPFVHICGSRDTPRKAADADIVVYSNMDSVELSLNGAKISKQNLTSDIHKFVWKNVKLSPGQNVIHAVGTSGDDAQYDRCVIELKQ